MKIFNIKLNTILTKAEVLPHGSRTGGFKGIYIIADYNRIKEILGNANIIEKNEGDGKIQAEWILSTENGNKSLTVYDYKEYTKSYKKVTNWHIGGNYNKSEAISILMQLGFKDTELEYNEGI